MGITPKYITANPAFSGSVSLESWIFCCKSAPEQTPAVSSRGPCGWRAEPPGTPLHSGRSAPGSAWGCGWASDRQGPTPRWFPPARRKGAAAVPSSWPPGPSGAASGPRPIQCCPPFPVARTAPLDPGEGLVVDLVSVDVSRVVS